MAALGAGRLRNLGHLGCLYLAAQLRQDGMGRRAVMGLEESEVGLFVFACL